jgi:hypothetical protein
MSATSGSRSNASSASAPSPFEELIQAARETDGPLWVQCFPRHPSIAEAAIFVALDRYPSNLLFTPEQAAQHKPAATFCYGRVNRRHQSMTRPALRVFPCSVHFLMCSGVT